MFDVVRQMIDLLSQPINLIAGHRVPYRVS